MAVVLSVNTGAQKPARCTLGGVERILFLFSLEFSAAFLSRAIGGLCFEE
jgi:hypothetical protein